MNDTFVGRLGDVFGNPGRLMDHVGENPRWWQPGLLVFLLIAAFSWLTAPVAAPEQLEVMRDSKLMSAMPEDQWQARYEEALNISPTARTMQSIGAGFMVWIMIMVFGLALGFFARMSGGLGTMKQALGIVSWGAVIPFGLGSLVKAPLVLITESVFRVNIGLAALLPDPDPGSLLFQVLMTYGDFFTWWGLVLLVVGFGRVYTMKRGPATLSVLLPWALLSLIPMGISLLFM